MIRRTRPTNLEDLAVEVAIVGPGPIVGGAVNPYVRRREDQRRARAAGRPYEPPLEHPLLKEALAETLGVILYQDRSEEHTSELQSPCNLVCRLLLEKKKNNNDRRQDVHDKPECPSVLIGAMLASFAYHHYRYQLSI